MKEKKIYLSLDDLHKLYGIAPDLILKRKRTKKKRKAKGKKKTNFGTGVNKQFGGGGGGPATAGVGAVHSSTIDRREIDILRGQLNEARNNPKNPANDGVLRLENVPEELKETFKFAKLANDGYASGNIKVSKSPAGNLIMGPTSQKQKTAQRRRAIDVSSRADNTINPAPPIQTSNDLTYTQPLEFKSNDQVEELDDDEFEDDVEDLPLEPKTKLAKPKGRTQKQKEATKQLVQRSKDKKSERLNREGMEAEDYDADKAIRAKNHYEKRHMRQGLEGLFVNMEPITGQMSRTRRTEMNIKQKDEIEDENMHKLRTKHYVRTHKIKPPSTPVPAEYFTPRKENEFGWDEWRSDISDEGFA